MRSLYSMFSLGCFILAILPTITSATLLVYINRVAIDSSVIGLLVYIDGIYIYTYLIKK